MDVNIKEVDNISPVTIAAIQSIAPVEISSIDKIEKIAPVAVHIKELNQVEPLLIEFFAHRPGARDRSSER